MRSTDFCYTHTLVTNNNEKMHSSMSGYQIELVINQLPKLPSNAHYLCVFNESITSKAAMTSNGLICNSPPSHLRPTIQSDRGMYMMI